MNGRVFGDNWNFWTVKYLRQMRHDKALLLMGIVLLLVEFLIFRSMFGERDPRPVWPWAVPLVLPLCGFGTALCLALGFANLAPRKDGRPGLSHFIGFAPLNGGTLFRGFLLAALFTFGVLFACCAPFWLAVLWYFPTHCGELLLWTLEAFFLTLFLIQPDTRRWARLDLLVAVLFLIGWMSEWFYDLPPTTVTIVFGLLAAWQLLGFRDALPPSSAVREVWPRVGQLGMLLAGWWLSLPGFRLSEPLPVMVGALGAFASMAAALGGIPARHLEGLPGTRFRRFFAFLLYGGSAGGWLWSWAAAAAGWGILFCYKESDFWRFLLPWGLAWAEGIFLLLARYATPSQRESAAKVYHFEVAGGLCATGVILMLVVATGGGQSISTAMFEKGALAGWIVAALLFLPLIPRLVRDFRRIVGGRQLP